jgi:hypothetical protein
VITVFGVHPLILFNIVFPMADQAVLGSPEYQYVAWVSMFIGSQLLSPVSISAILAASAIGVSPVRTSYRLHYRFALFFGVLMWGYLSFVGCLNLYGWILPFPG